MTKPNVETEAGARKKAETPPPPPPPPPPHDEEETAAADGDDRQDDDDAAGTTNPPHDDGSSSASGDNGDYCDGVPFDEADHADGRSRYEGGGGGGTTVAAGAAATAAETGQRPPKGKKTPNPYIGKLVIAVRGRHQGTRGIVREAGRGGWWTIDVVVGGDEDTVPASSGAAAVDAAATAIDSTSMQLKQGQGGQGEQSGSQPLLQAAADRGEGGEPTEAVEVKDTTPVPAPGVPSSDGSGKDDNVSLATGAADADADASSAAVPTHTYRPTGVVVKVQNGHCRMLDPVTVEEIDAYNQATGAWLSLIRPYRRSAPGDRRAAANSGDCADSDMEGGDDDDEDDDDDGDDTRGHQQKRNGGDGGRAGRKRGRRGSGVGGGGSRSSYYLHDDPLSSADRDVLWTRLQPPDGCPPSWRDWREALPPYVLERLAEASVPPPALRVAGNKMPRRSVVACTYDVIAGATTDGPTMEQEKGGSEAPLVDFDAKDREALPMSRPSPSNVATKLVVNPAASQSLPPVVLPSTSADDDATILSSVPKAIRHLPLESKVDIFDRKTGRVLSGRSAVLVRDLASVLRAHASYEPIVPPSAIEDAVAGAVAEAAKRAGAVRQGRTAPNITVSANIEPQVRVRASAMEGREVIVTEGRLRGLVGKIEACLPGGWYVVSDLLSQTEQGVEHVVSSASLDLLESSQKSMATATNVPLDGDVTLPSAKDLVESFKSTAEKLYSNPIRQMTLRLEEMEKEKESIASYLGLDENGEVRDIEKTKTTTGLHGLRIHQLQQRWGKLDQDIEGMKTKRTEYESAGEGIRSELPQLLGIQNKPHT